MPTLQADKAKSGRHAAQALVKQLRGQINQGRMRPGDRLLSERKLAERYDAPLHTVRLALNYLKADGALVSRPKSGIYVADLQSATAMGEPAMHGWPPAHFPETSRFMRAAAEQNSINMTGFSLLDVPDTSISQVYFLAANWDRHSRRFWERVCRQYRAAGSSEVQVEASFPSSHREYRRLRPWSDAFISTHMEMYKGGRIWSEIDLFEVSQLRAAGIDERYIDAAREERFGSGMAIGVPLSACLMTGLLNTHLLPGRLVQPLLSARTWDEAFDLLTEASALCPGCTPLNIHGSFTFNIHQYLTVAAGGLLHQGRFDLRRPAVRGALERLGRFLDDTASRPARDGGRPSSQSCLAEIDYTCRATQVAKEGQGWVSWLYPLGEGGRYLEGINLGFINRASPHRREARDFLLHLASPAQQHWITRSPREQSISAELPSLWQAYSPEEARILSTMRRQAVVFGEWAPGYVRAVEEILPEMSSQWLAGQLSTDEFCRAVEDRGNACLRASQQEIAA